MHYYLERLQIELNSIMDFWNQIMLSKDKVSILPEFSEGKPLKNDSILGSMYLSRIIYGSSAACRFRKDIKYKNLADIAFKLLYEQFRNPAGGFYWAKTQSNKIVHDSNNINIAQAFVLYGLAEY
jgi:mannose/cellobiose epimerase-like protein (N-acyl-D-glucosamine 2-epimerase family)